MSEKVTKAFEQLKTSSWEFIPDNGPVNAVVDKIKNEDDKVAFINDVEYFMTTKARSFELAVNMAVAARAYNSAR